jgi:nonribosomal peptide synthetase protein BlmIV
MTSPDRDTLESKRSRLSAAQREQLLRRLGGGARRTRDEPGPRLEHDAAGRHDPFPLTDLQEAYLLGREPGFELGGVGSHVYYELDVTGTRPEAFRDAWRLLVERHDMLRAVFSRDGTQRVLAEVPQLDVPIVDLADSEAAAVARELAALRARMSTRVRDPALWPLFEVCVVTLPGGRVQAHICFDVLLCDGQSLHVLMAEIELLCERPDAELPALEVTFRDWCLARRAAGEERRLRRARDYWMERVGELPDAPDLPLEHGGAGADRAFTRRSSELGRDSWQHLRERAARAGVTPSGVLLAAFAEVVAAWSTSPRFLLNLTLFDRRAAHPQIDAVVGDFSSTSLFAADTARGESFEERARAAQELLWRDLDNSAFSGVRVARELAARRGREHGAIAPVVFTSLLQSGPALQFPWPLVHGASQTPQVVLDVQVAEYEGELRFLWDTREGVLAAGVVDAMFDAYCSLLARLASGEAAWTEAAPDLIPGEQRERRVLANSTGDDAPDGLLHGGLRGSSARDPGRPALIDGDRELSYGELHERALAVAARLREAGVERGDRVGIALPKGPDQVVAVAAVLEAGGAYVPIDPALPPLRQRQMAESCRPRAALVASGSEPGWTAGLACVDPAAPGPPPAGAAPAFGDGRDLAYVIYTSGSTGTPKGVAIEHRSALNTVLDINSRFGVGPADRVLGLSSLSFDLSVYDVFGTFAAGAALVLPSRDGERDPRRWLAAMDAAGVTIWNSAPALMQMLVEHAESAEVAPLERVRLVLLSGDWIPVGLPDRVRRMLPNAQVVSLGGATEASIWSNWFPIERVDPGWASIPYGTPLRNQRMHVYDDRLRWRPDWVRGEVYIGGAGLARGYFGDPRTTAERFVPHPVSGERLYRTGDLGRYLPDGTIEFLGRGDDQVKVQGHRVELGEIEAALSAHPAVDVAVASAIGSVDSGRRLVAHVVGRDGVDPDALLDHVAERLPRHMVPARIDLVDSLPLTANGKVDRRALLAAPAPPPARPAHAASTPRTPLERTIAGAWAEVLGEAPAAVGDDFFRRGGTSILAMRLCASLEDRFGPHTEIPLAAFFEDPTIAGLAALLEPRVGELVPPQPPPARDHDGAPAAGARTAGDDGAPFPLTEIQQAYLIGRAPHFELGGVGSYAYTELDGDDLDLDRFAAAWRRLVERHDMLRAVFTEDGTQRVLAEHPPVEVPIDDLSGLSAEARAGALASTRSEMSHRVMDPGRFPLFEVRVSVLGDEGVRVHVGVDLLVADAWSTVILSRDLATFYRDPDAELPPLGVGFRDHVVAQEEAASTDRGMRSLAYWRERARSLPPPPGLGVVVADRGAPPRFVRRSYVLDAARWERLGGLAAAAGLTPSTVLCTAFADVLASWSAEPRFTINVPVFHRVHPHPDIDGVVGDFTSLNLLEVDARSASTFAERAGAVATRIATDLDHRWAGGIRAVRELARARAQHLAALAPVVFTSTLGIGGEDVPGGGGSPWAALPLRPGYGVSQTPQVWLDLQVGQRDGALVCDWDAVDAIFPDGLLDGLVADFGELVEELAEKGLDQPGPARVRPKPASPPAPAAPVAAPTAPAPSPRNPVERLRFRLERRGLDGADGPRVELPRPGVDAALTARYVARRSFRQFAPGAVERERFAAFLSCLMAIDVEGYPLPKHLYGSAGGLYPVQAHLLIAPDRIEGLAGGRYRYDPRDHALVRTGEGMPIPRLQTIAAPGRVTDPAFAVLLVARTDAVEPVYGEHAREFCVLEAGAMSQLLEETAVTHGLGLCQVGALDLEALGVLEGLGDGCAGTHALVGGPIDPVQLTPAGLVEDERETIEFVRLATRGPAPTDAGAVADVRGDVLAAWGDVLGPDALGERPVRDGDSFFALGGDSLGLVRLHARLREQLGCDPSIEELFRFPTLAGHCRVVAGARAAGPLAPATGASDAVERGRRRAAMRRARRDGGAS